MFLKGGAIVPTGPVIQHVGAATVSDTITLLIALDDKGKFCTHPSFLLDILPPPSVSIFCVSAIS